MITGIFFVNALVWGKYENRFTITRSDDDVKAWMTCRGNCGVPVAHQLQNQNDTCR